MGRATVKTSGHRPIGDHAERIGSPRAVNATSEGERVVGDVKIANDNRTERLDTRGEVGEGSIMREESMATQGGSGCAVLARMIGWRTLPPENEVWLAESIWYYSKETKIMI